MQHLYDQIIIYPYFSIEPNWCFALINTVDNYTKKERAVNYAIIFIAFTFLIIFMSEILTKDFLHPIQYGFIGLELVIFYLFLLSLSEYIRFDLSYWLSTLMVIAILFIYLKTILKNLKASLITSFVILVIYVYLFILLQLEDYSLLAGSMGLFVLVSALMLISGKIDWDNVGIGRAK